MMRYGFSLVWMLAMLITASCAAKKSGNVFVLLPGPDGKTGAIQITSREGTRILNEPKQSVEVPSADAAPSTPVTMKDDKIRSIFGEALSALPQPPLHFVLYFDFDSTELSKESRRQLRRILPAMIERKSADVSVIGHTDRAGSREYNYELGMKRARLIEKILESQGIAPHFISVASHGEDNPLVRTDDGVREWRNRRVEVIVR